MNYKIPKKFNSLYEVWSFLFQFIQELNNRKEDLVIGNTRLTEEELKKLKKLIGGK